MIKLMIIMSELTESGRLWGCCGRVNVDIRDKYGKIAVEIILLLCSENDEDNDYHQNDWLVVIVGLTGGEFF